MKVADYIINFLGKKGVKHAFVVTGAADANLIDAFSREKEIKHIAVFHEQAGGFAAEGYAKISGNLGFAIATSGPGGQNLVTPIANCYYDSIPSLFLTGQVNSQFVRPDSSMRQLGFQETPISEIVRPITKYSAMVSNPKDIKYELEKATHVAQSDRPGPVLLDLPMDVQRADINLESLVGFDSSLSNSVNYDLIDRKIESFLRDIKNSKRPAILVGSGVRLAKAIPELLEVAEKLKIPCFPTWNALDIVTSDLQIYGGRVGTYGGPGRNFGIQNSDLLLLVGSRLSGRITGGNVSSFARAAKKYYVDIDPILVQKKYQQVQFEESILSDAKTFLGRLSDAIRTEKICHNNYLIPDFSGWLKRNQDWRDRYDPVKPEHFNSEKINPYAFMRILSDEMKNNDILVGDCGGNIVLASHAFKTKHGQRFITSNGNSPMGFSFAGAMGAYMASEKSGNTVCIIGDGGFNMNIQELQTIKNYDMNFKTFILNNSCYGIIRAYQRTNLESRFLASGPEGYIPPDFMRICEAYGIRTSAIKKTSEIKGKIREVLDSKEAVVCNVNIEGFDNYEPRVSGWRTPIEDMEPHLPREEFLKQMIIPPLEGWETAGY